MTGTWERLADAPFALDPQIEAEAYIWHGPGQDRPYSIEFQAPKEAPHRRFYPVEVLEALKRGEPADDYVERMCRLGIGLLPELEAAYRQEISAATGSDEQYAGKEMPTPDVLEFLLAVFESRRGGHQRVTRDFHRVDDFFGTEGSRRAGDFLVPGVPPPRRSSNTPLTSQDIMRHVTDSVGDTSTPSGVLDHLEIPLFLSPMRTPLDQILVEGVFRRGEAGNTRTINDTARAVAPALINGISLDDDGRFIGDHPDEFLYFLRRLGTKCYQDRSGFGDWLKQEREKGFVRLFPGSKKFSETEAQEARCKGTRFYRRVLWTSYEAMARCYAATALHMWVSFCQSDAVRPSLDEQRGFRDYHAPQVFAGGLPVWVFGANVLRWFLEGFIERVWGWREGQDFDALTHLVALYAATARERRDVDAGKKRLRKVARHRPDLLAGTQPVQFTEDSDGKTLLNRTPAVAPVEMVSDEEAKCPDFPQSRTCDCGGVLLPSGEPENTDSWILIDTECVACGREQTYRLARPVQPH